MKVSLADAPNKLCPFITAPSCCQTTGCMAWRWATEEDAQENHVRISTDWTYAHEAIKVARDEDNGTISFEEAGDLMEKIGERATAALKDWQPPTDDTFVGFVMEKKEVVNVQDGRYRFVLRATFVKRKADSERFGYCGMARKP